MLKKLGSVALIGFLSLSLTACWKKETPPPAPVTDKENIGINIKVEDQQPVEDKEDVGVNVEVKEDNTPPPAPTY